MSDSYSITEARAKFGDLVRRAAHSHERITITDHGRPAAAIVNVTDLEDLEDELALARYEARVARGDTSGQLTHEQVGRMLGFRSSREGKAAG